jgi:signal transduction histidine kinase/ActR/RegA family two-component response regulator
MLVGSYQMPLVLISILVAILASYTGLRLSGRVATASGKSKRWWVAGGAVALGAGIWSMHFIGMLAFRLPIPLGYNFGITLLSLLVGVASSWLALWLVSQGDLDAKRLMSGGILMGCGITIMHYTGMGAMRMDPGIDYDPVLFASSVVIAICASGTALWMAFKLQHDIPNGWILRLGAAAVMGFAIAGMHYVGMAAANFPADSICFAARAGANLDTLAMLVITGIASVLAIALLACVFDARIEASMQVLADSRALSEERRHLLEREREARAEAERLSELKDEFLATLSHELRTPLNAILGWAQLLRVKGKDEATLIRGVDTIERNSRAQARLIDDLLDVSRIISGKVRLTIDMVKPGTFISAAIETVQPAAHAKQIKIESSLDADVESISGDIDRLQQVMWNLLSNAVKFTPNGGKVQVVLRRGKGESVITVSDTGAGISPDFLPYVFDRFRQADASTTRKHGGLGLGLSIVRQLVELQGGTVEAASNGEGKGAVFTVRFPEMQSRSSVIDQPRPDVAALTSVPVDVKLEDLSGIKVLVVDDEADARDLVGRVLGYCGAEVVLASSAEQALQMLLQEGPHVLISDIGMPDVDGFQLIRRVRKLQFSQAANVPAIALTAFTRDDDRRRALEAGFSDYLCKPVEAAELIAKVTNAVGGDDARAVVAHLIRKLA